MSVTKQQVLEKAKNLGITLSDQDADLFVKLGVLPIKGEEGGSSTEGNDKNDDDDNGDGDDSGKEDGAQKRIKQLVNQKKELAKQNAEITKRLKDLEELAAKTQRQESEKKGDYEKLLKETEEAKVKLEKSIEANKEKFKTKAIEDSIKEALRDAGVPSNRLNKALRLFDSSKIEFAWTNEDSYEYEIEQFSDLVTEFKNDNDFLFVEGSEDSTGHRGNAQPGSNKKHPVKSKEEELRRLYPALGN